MGKIGKNSFDIQESNRVSVLRILSKEDVLTRADLSRMTGLKQATITNIINDLLSSGVVSETGTLKGNLGRRSIGIRLNAENFNVVGIKIARRSYSVGIFNIKNQLLDKTYQKLEPSTGASAVLQSLRSWAVKSIRVLSLEKIWANSRGNAITPAHSTTESIILAVSRSRKLFFTRPAFPAPKL